MKNRLFSLTIVVAFCFVATAFAQPPRGGRGGPPPGMNQTNLNNLENVGNQFGNQAAQIEKGIQTMPTIEQLAQMMIANFDADANSELNQAELQRALTALRQMMQNQAGG